MYFRKKKNINSGNSQDWRQKLLTYLRDNVIKVFTQVLVHVTKTLSQQSLWKSIKNLTHSPEIVPSQASIAVWSLLSPPVQVWVWQLFQPQRIHLTYSSLSLSLSPWLPSFLAYFPSTPGVSPEHSVHTLEGITSRKECVKILQPIIKRLEPLLNHLQLQKCGFTVCTPISSFSPHLPLLWQVKGRKSVVEDERAVPLSGLYPLPPLSPPTSPWLAPLFEKNAREGQERVQTNTVKGTNTDKCYRVLVLKTTLVYQSLMWGHCHSYTVKSLK